MPVRFRVEGSAQRDTFLSIPASQNSSGQTSGSLSFHITAYQLRGCPVVKLRVMSHQNYGIDMHCLGVLNCAGLNWHTVWVIHPEERGLYVSALLLASYCKLLQILMSSQEKSEHPLALPHFLSTCVYPYHLSVAFWLFCVCVCILSLLLMFTVGWVSRQLK
jgi:hypothetical protein